jgi:hypothetical protein
VDRPITFGTSFLYIQNGDLRDIKWKGYLNVVRNTQRTGWLYTGGAMKAIWL